MMWVRPRWSQTCTADGDPGEGGWGGDLGGYGGCDAGGGYGGEGGDPCLEDEEAGPRPAEGAFYAVRCENLDGPSDSKLCFSEPRSSACYLRRYIFTPAIHHPCHASPHRR